MRIQKTKKNYVRAFRKVSDIKPHLILIHYQRQRNKFNRETRVSKFLSLTSRQNRQYVDHLKSISELSKRSNIF